MKPKHFCSSPDKFKAFVLGCDPSNNSDNGKRVDLEYVFGIGQDVRYFRDILANLNTHVKQKEKHIKLVVAKNLKICFH